MTPPPLDSARPLIASLRGWRKAFASLAVSVFERGLTRINLALYKACERNEDAAVIDCGTGDTKLFNWLNEKIGSHEYALLDAMPNGGSVMEASLEDHLPAKSESADVVIASQVIEHLIDTPGFLAECCRVLKPGGYMVLATENLASWPNVGCLLLGWFPFSLTNCFGPPIGNPLVWHAQLQERHAHRDDWKAKRWGCIGHQRIFTLRTLRQLCAAAGFHIEQTLGSSHSHFIGLKLRK